MKPIQRKGEKEKEKEEQKKNWYQIQSIRMGERRARERERGGWGEGKETREGCNLKLSLLASEYLKKLIPAISNAPGKHKSVHIISRTIIFHQEKIHRLGEPYRDPPSILQRVSSDSQLLKFGRAGESQYSPAIYLDDCSCSDLATGANQLINPATTIMNNSWFQRSNSFINCGRRSHRAPLRFQIPAQKMKKNSALITQTRWPRWPALIYQHRASLRLVGSSADDIFNSYVVTAGLWLLTYLMNGD